MRSKPVRNKVILGKTSLEILKDLDAHAQKMNCHVVIAESAGEPFYWIVPAETVQKMTSESTSYVGASKEAVLTKLIDYAGDTRGKRYNDKK